MRLGVALLIPPPFDREIDMLRRATGDGTYGRVPAHVTLVPPVNVNQDLFGDAQRVLREAGAATRPFTVHLGPPATFLPANPVLYLPLAGVGRSEVFSLREKVFRAPLARILTWPFVPHVTVADEAKPDRIRAAEVALADYAAHVTFDRVHLLQESPGRVWRPVVEAPFAAPAVVGRGGLPLELAVTVDLDAAAGAFVQAQWSAERHRQGFCGDDPDRRNLSVVGRRDGEIVGVAEGWARAGTARLAGLIVSAEKRNEGIGSHLLSAFGAAAADRGCARLGAEAWAGSRGEAFLRRRGWAEEGRRRQWWGERDLVLLRRDRSLS